jgi:hypothetical protein
MRIQSYGLFCCMNHLSTLFLNGTKTNNAKYADQKISDSLVYFVFYFGIIQGNLLVIQQLKTDIRQ